MAIKYSSYDATSGNTFALNGLTAVSGIFTSRVGIGVSNPSVSLDIDGGTASEVLRLKSSSSSAAVQQTFIQDTYGYIGGVGSASYWDATLPITNFGISSNSNLNFVTSGTARASITESGKFLIGTTTPIATSIGVAGFQVVGTDNPSAQIQLSRFSADADTPRLILTKSRSSTIGTNTIVQNGDVLGRFQFRGADGATSSSYQVAAEILCTVDSIPGSGICLAGFNCLQLQLVQILPLKGFVLIIKEGLASILQLLVDPMAPIVLEDLFLVARVRRVFI